MHPLFPFPRVLSPSSELHSPKFLQSLGVLRGQEGAFGDGEGGAATICVVTNIRARKSLHWWELVEKEGGGAWAPCQTIRALYLCPNLV